MIREEFGSQVLIAPEAAGILLDGGFPGYGNPPDQALLDAFQTAVFIVGEQILPAHRRLAEIQGGIRMIVLDRSPLDGEAYVPPGYIEGLIRRPYDREAILAEYDAIIFLDTYPEDWNRTDGNEHRFEKTPEYALALNERTWDVYKGAGAIRVTCDGGFEHKTASVLAEIRRLLAG